MSEIAKKDLEKAVSILKKYADSIEDYEESGAVLGVANSITKAIEEAENIGSDVLCLLKIEKVPTKEEIALEKSCSTDCIRFRKGDCPFLYEERSNCPRVRQIYEDLFGEDKNVE